MRSLFAAAGGSGLSGFHYSSGTSAPQVPAPNPGEVLQIRSHAQSIIEAMESLAAIPSAGAAVTDLTIPSASGIHYEMHTPVVNRALMKAVTADLKRTFGLLPLTAPIWPNAANVLAQTMPYPAVTIPVTPPVSLLLLFQ
jgi:hypothetical protein